MLAYKALKDILDRSVGWERELGDLLDVALIGLTNAASQKLVSSLKKRQDDILEVLINIDFEAFGPAEWVQFMGDLDRDELIPRKSITRKSPPEEIISHIREYEEALRTYYERIADIINVETQRDLFNSLVQLKDAQIEQLNYL